MSHCETDIPVAIPPATSFLNLIKTFPMTYKRINIHSQITAKFVPMTIFYSISEEEINKSCLC